MEYNTIGLSDSVLAKADTDIKNLRGHLGFEGNCYSYAINDRNPYYHCSAEDGYDVSLSPGDKHGKPFSTAHTVSSNPRANDEVTASIIKGAEEDGLQFIGKSPRHQKGKYLIAYFQKPGGTAENDSSDFHFMRQDNDGGWSHKIIDRPVSRTDLDGRLIIDPRTAHMGDYKFVGFFLAPEDGIQLHANRKMNLSAGIQATTFKKPGSMQIHATSLSVTPPKI